MAPPQFYTKQCSCSLLSARPHLVTNATDWARHLLAREQDRLDELFDGPNDPPSPTVADRDNDPDPFSGRESAGDPSTSDVDDDADRDGRDDPCGLALAIVTENHDNQGPNSSPASSHAYAYESFPSSPPEYRPTVSGSSDGELELTWQESYDSPDDSNIPLAPSISQDADPPSSDLDLDHHSSSSARPPDVLTEYFSEGNPPDVPIEGFTFIVTGFG